MRKSLPHERPQKAAPKKKFGTAIYVYGKKLSLHARLRVAHIMSNPAPAGLFAMDI
jgi:hypothetical protein